MKTKHLLLAFVMMIFVFTANAQQGINYKAIINDNNGDPLANTAITVQFTILENGTTNVYQEIHGPTTDANGIIIVDIGEGTPVGGDFSAINWGGNPHFLKTEIDTGDGLTDLGTTEFKTVPYAIYAETANEVQNLSQVLNEGNSADNKVITNLGAPSVPTDATSKAYVDGLFNNVVFSSDLTNHTKDMMRIIEALDWRIQQLEMSLLDHGILEAVDVEGNVYLSVQIGDQAWMTVNLKTTTYNDGSPITEWDDSGPRYQEGKYCWLHNDEETYKDIFGALYDGYAVISGKLCPAGWHVPTDFDWKRLEIYLGMDPGEVDETNNDRGRDAQVADRLKAPYGGPISDWTGTNSSGFGALPGGMRLSGFLDDGSKGYWWTSTFGNHASCYFRAMEDFRYGIERNEKPLDEGLSVRCIRDQQFLDCYDGDKDGFGVGPDCEFEDCDDRNPHRYPGAPDVPGDGVDSNCDGHD